MSLTDTNPTVEKDAATDAHDAHHDEVNPTTVKAIFAVLAALLVAWGTAIYAYGVPGLYIPALCFVPVMYAILITIAKG
jgi:sterol desaturase/sphingolipid hydroxylase (fatty acid hydroxylase superfamily)